MNPAQRQVNETAAKKNGKSPALIALLCVLCGCLVVLVGVCIYFFLNDDDASEKNQTKDKETKTSAVAYSTESTEAIIETFIQSAPVETEYEPEVTEAVQKETLNLHLTYDYIDFDVPASGYVFEDSSNRLIKESELYALTEHQCCIARNEIFARHGRKFADKRISEYFNALPWYTGRIDGSVFDANIDSYLSATEKKNIETIRAYELRVYGG